jgi:lipoate-protein ligase A
VTRRLVGAVAESGEPGVRVWYPPRYVAFGRRDRRVAGYDRARDAAEARGYPALERDTGGRAVAFTGGTLAVVRAEPVDPREPAIDTRYDGLLADLETALRTLGVDAARGEPANAFCPGTRSLSAGGKIAGLAQRVTADVATIAAVVVVRDAEAVRAVLDPVYAALDVPFDPASVGSLAAAGGVADPDVVRRAVEAAVRDAAATP